MSFLRTFKNIFKLPELRLRFINTLIIFAIYRFIAHIPAPGINRESLSALFQSSQFLSLLDVFSGGTLANFSILALSIGPYINASIIIQMLTLVIPQLEALGKEGDYGRQKINQYTRLLTIPLSLIQAIGLIMLLRSQNLVLAQNALSLLSIIITLSAGTMLLMWLGDIITERGLGNGISMVIFAGIVARVPISIAQTASSIDSTNFARMVVMSILAVIVVYLIVKTTEAIRRIPISYARRSSKGGLQQSTHLPLRLNQAGVIPIIFAVSLMLIPNMLSGVMRLSSNPVLVGVSDFISNHLAQNSLLFNALYFLLIVGFTYFYTAVVFNPEKISSELKQFGGFIPGIRPGKPTTKYLSYILNRTTLAGGAILAIIAILPSIISSVTGVTTISIGGTSLLIVVAVILEVMRSIQSQFVMHDYDKFL